MKATIHTHPEGRELIGEVEEFSFVKNPVGKQSPHILLTVKLDVSDIEDLVVKPGEVDVYLYREY